MGNNYSIVPGLVKETQTCSTTALYLNILFRLTLIVFCSCCKTAVMGGGGVRGVRNALIFVYEISRFLEISISEIKGLWFCVCELTKIKGFLLGFQWISNRFQWISDRTVRDFVSVSDPSVVCCVSRMAE